MKQVISAYQPILSSKELDWNDILCEYYIQPPGGCARPAITYYMLAINLGYSVRIDYTLGQGKKEHLQHKNLIAGDICILPPYMEGWIRWNRTSEFIVLYLNADLIKSSLCSSLETEQIEITPKVGVCDPFLHQIGLAFKAEIEERGTSGHLYRESLTNALVLHLIKGYSESRKRLHDLDDEFTKYRLLPVLDYINDNLEKELTLAELSSLINLSTYHFTRIFKQAIGFTPYQYLTKRRIERAKELLAHKGLPIAEISQRVGFQTQSRFTTLFRRYTAITPKVFRDSL